jgi:hypothetical protein
MSRRRLVLAGAGVGLAAVVAVVGVVVTDGFPATAGTPSATTTTAGPSSTSASPDTGAAPVTDEPTEAAPAEPEEPEPGPADPTTGQTVATDPPVQDDDGSVEVLVTMSEWSAADDRALVAGYVSGVVEDGGTCTLTLTSGGARVTAENAAMADAATTSCGALTVPGDRLAPGTWSATLAYESPTSSGSSSPVRIEVSS